MHLFNILNFKTASLHQVEEYLTQHNSLRYEISIPKKEFNNDTDFIRWQYYMAAFAGHKLSLVSTSFAYNVPCPYRSDPFRFEIEYNYEKKLAAALHYIIKGYYTDRDTAITFLNEALMHYHNCFNNKTESNCWGLLHIANKKQF
jgi:hypothetical protein